MEVAINEISTSLFSEKLKNTTEPFFPNAAKDLFGAILTHFSRNKKDYYCDNLALRQFIDAMPTSQLRQMLQQHEDLKALTSYIYDDKSGQTQGVLSELQQQVRTLFIGNFKRRGQLSMRNLIRQKGGKAIFIEYDLSVGKTLTPVYSLLFDLAIKEALSRKKSEGNVYFVVDEFRLLPNLTHIDDAVNFGRSMGVKFMIQRLPKCGANGGMHMGRHGQQHSLRFFDQYLFSGKRYYFLWSLLRICMVIIERRRSILLLCREEES